MLIFAQITSLLADRRLFVTQLSPLFPKPALLADELCDGGGQLLGRKCQLREHGTRVEDLQDGLSAFREGHVVAAFCFGSLLGPLSTLLIETSEGFPQTRQALFFFRDSQFLRRLFLFE